MTRRTETELTPEFIANAQAALERARKEDPHSPLPGFGARPAPAPVYGVEGLRLRALADELNAMEARMREIAYEIGYRPEFKKLLPREFHSLHEVKRGVAALETAASKAGVVVGILRGGAQVIQPYDVAVEAE